MFILAGPVTGFLPFIQILCWIILPVLVSSVSIAVFMHYRRRKRDSAATPSTKDELLSASPEQVGYTRGDGEYVLFDHSDLILEYKNRLSFHHARYTALQQDFSSLESKYTALAGYASAAFIIPKKKNMENVQGTMPKQLQEEVSRLVNTHTAEKKEIEMRLEQLGRSYQSLEQENESLLQQLSLTNGSEEEKALLINSWKEENIVLKDRLAEQDYIKDILEEKNAQISFLQTQLEQRIKNQHQVEHAKSATEKQLQEAREENIVIRGEVINLQQEILQRREEADKLQVVVCQKEEQIEGKRQTILSRQDQITYLENLLHETKQQNELLNAEAADNRDRVELMQQQLDDERARLQYMEQKLNNSKQQMRRIYKELAAAVGEENEPSPVISLRPDYITLENGENALHTPA